MKIEKAVKAQTVVDQFYHNNLHTEALLKLYPDLGVIITDNSIEYYSTTINSEADQFEFRQEHPVTYAIIYSIFPYKNVQISCDRCNGIIRVNSNPSRIPLVWQHEYSYNNYNWYGLLYEEITKINNFSPATISAIQLHIISELDNQTKSLSSNKKIDVYYLNNSIKKLLPFT